MANDKPFSSDLEWSADNLATTEDLLENAKHAVKTDHIAIQAKRRQLEQREKLVIQLEEKVEYWKADYKQREKLIERWNMEISDLEITIELLQEDPGNEDKVIELEKKLVEINRLLTN
jgi:chromosome segregation ATPase